MSSRVVVGEVVRLEMADKVDDDQTPRWTLWSTR